MDVLLLSDADVRRALPPEVVLESQREAFASLGRSEALLPERLLLAGADGSMAFCYAARLGAHGHAVSKFGSLNPRNSERGLPSISALVTVLDPETGGPLAIMDGAGITETRTAAASALAAEILAPDARELAVVGAGVQGGAHVRAIAHTHGLERVRLWSSGLPRAERLAAELRNDLDIDVAVAGSAREAVEQSALVVLATTSPLPVVETGWLAHDAVVISVGSFARDRHEVPADFVDRADVVVDHRPTALSDAGPVVAAVDRGTLVPAHIQELGNLVVGRPLRRTHEFVYYNSVGVGVQDSAAAVRATERARELSLGTLVTL